MSAVYPLFPKEFCHRSITPMRVGDFRPSRLAKPELGGRGATIFSTHAQAIDWHKVDDALGRKPAISGDVHRDGFPAAT